MKLRRKNKIIPENFCYQRGWIYRGLCWGALLFFFSMATAQTVLDPRLALRDSHIQDQDDMCIWIHPDPSQSLIITSDKDAYELFVYDLSGKTHQSISVPGKPSNIDVRYNFPLSGEPTDIVAYVDRDNNDVVIYRVQLHTRKLSLISRFDTGKWTREIYGFCLYQSPFSGKYYAFASDKSSRLRQWELIDNGEGGIEGIEKRNWMNGSSNETEGLVADDETGKLYAANEEDGVYAYDADPVDKNPAGELLFATGTQGLTPDIEGITIYYAADGEGYILVSNQGSDNFKVFERRPPHRLIMTFQVRGVEETDGIDVTNVNLGAAFPQGIFLLHNHENEKKEVLVCDFADLKLKTDTDYWNPRALSRRPLKITPSSRTP